jgi:hypothetical protein
VEASLHDIYGQLSNPRSQHVAFHVGLSFAMPLWYVGFRAVDSARSIVGMDRKEFLLSLTVLWIVFACLLLLRSQLLGPRAGHTFCTVESFEEVAKAIHDCAFVNTDLPVVLSLVTSLACLLVHHTGRQSTSFRVPCRRCIAARRNNACSQSRSSKSWMLL